MGEYRTNEAHLELPGGWMDVSVNALEYPRPDGKIRLLVTRLPREKGTLDELVDKRLVEQRRKLPFFDIVDRHAKTLAGQPCVEVSLTYKDGELSMLQRTVSFVLGPRFVVLAAVGRVEQKGELTALLDRALNSLEVRKIPE